MPPRGDRQSAPFGLPATVVPDIKVAKSHGLSVSTHEADLEAWRDRNTLQLSKDTAREAFEKDGSPGGSQSCHRKLRKAETFPDQEDSIDESVGVHWLG